MLDTAISIHEALYRCLTPLAYHLPMRPSDTDSKDIKRMHQLLAMGADPSAILDNNRCLLLELAANTPAYNMPLFRTLVEHSQQINTCLPGHGTALHRAIQGRNLQTAAILLDAGARLDIVDYLGRSVMGLALLYSGTDERGIKWLRELTCQQQWHRVDIQELKHWVKTRRATHTQTRQRMGQAIAHIERFAPAAMVSNPMDSHIDFQAGLAQERAWLFQRQLSATKTTPVSGSIKPRL